MPEIIDISQPLRPGIPVFPGDTEYQPFDVMRMADGDSCNVGSVTMSLHTGTHADAPCHFDNQGGSIDEVGLDVYVGPAVVVDCVGATCIEPKQLEVLADLQIERVLFRTDSADQDRFTNYFAYLSKATARELVSRGVKLVGVDTPSVDHANSRDLAAHHILLAGNVAILENLSLGHVDPGAYELIALPLKLTGMDGSPVRAILRTLS